MSTTWYLIYGDGTEWRPIEGAKSVKHARPNAQTLVIVRDGRIITGVPLDRGDKPKPIFYTRRAIDNGPDAYADGEAFDLAVVFGRSTPDGKSVDLWTIDNRGSVVTCPKDLFAESAVQNCLGRS